jgi:hypothetical protein
VISCPKCGFQQPSDQYCAKCGVDVIAFAKSRLAIQQKRTRLLIPLVVGGFVIASALAFQLQRRGKLQLKGMNTIASETSDDAAASAKNAARLLSARVANSKNSGAALAANKQVDADMSSGGDGRSQSASNAENNTTAQSEVEIPAMAQSLVASQAPTAAANALLADSGGSASGRVGSPGFVENDIPKNVWIVLGKVQSGFLQELERESTVKSDGAVTLGIHPTIETKTKQAGIDQQMTALVASTKRPLAMGQAVTVTEEASGHDLGIRLTVVPTQLDKNGAVVQIETLFFASSEERSKGQASSRSTISIPKGQGFWIRGAIPRRQLSEELSRAAESHSVLKILNLPDFQAGSTEFVIFVVLK